MRIAIQTQDLRWDRARSGHRALRGPSGEIPCKLCGSPTRHLGAPHLLLDQPRVLLAAPPVHLVRAVASRPAGWGAEVRLVQEGLQGEAHLPDADGGEPSAAAPVTVRRLGRVDDAQADAAVVVDVRVEEELAADPVKGDSRRPGRVLRCEGHRRREEAGRPDRGGLGGDLEPPNKHVVGAVRVLAGLRDKPHRTILAPFLQGCSEPLAADTNEVSARQCGTR
mmetsp:Transcript_25177/g.84888  ORF Transcript_25177/g.84888 Transcript_25177/m.84888 type:complete len:223 (+) Transcript_25177:142-810(+)